jgi:ZIP family zinc transporter
MLGALGWGTLAASSLVVGVLLAFARDWGRRQIGGVLAFGAGALISAVSFELAEEGVAIGGLGWTALGLALGALAYFGADTVLERPGARERSAGETDTGTALALGAFLDGIPEQLVLGIGLAGGAGISVSLLVAIFVSNLPEAVGSASNMLENGKGRGEVLRLWLGVAAICAVATVVGYLIADVSSGGLNAAINGFAAGALLVMLVDSMIPAAFRDAGREAGLITVIGFAVALALTSAS